MGFDYRFHATSDELSRFMLEHPSPIPPAGPWKEDPILDDPVREKHLARKRTHDRIAYRTVRRCCGECWAVFGGHCWWVTGTCPKHEQEKL